MLKVLYQDERVVAVHKPSGMVVHRSREARDSVTAMTLARDQLGRHVYPVHRLDRGTSGVLLFALDSESAASLQAQFASGAVRKSYFAIVRGWVEDAGEYASDRNGRMERTCWEPVARFEGEFAVGRYPTTRWSLVRVTPETGRRHQIRRHLQSNSHPILGDVIYGDGRHNRLAEEVIGHRRLWLMAKAIEFSGVRVEADWDTDFDRALKRLFKLSGDDAKVVSK